MKAQGQLKVLSRVDPNILISHYDLEQIRHVVRIAPQEAQWFHQVRRIQNEGNNTVTYHIYNMIIPEQECSAAQVETDPMQMMKMFKAVKANVEASLGEDPDPSEVSTKVNEIMATIGCWSHSHVNMGVGPSGTDTTTFKDRCQQASQIGNTEPQIMLIFNKRDDFFCRLYDPAVDGGVLFENVPIRVGTYDFSEVTAECKAKMKERKFTYSSKGKGGNLHDPKFWKGHGSRPTSRTGVDSPRGVKTATSPSSQNHSIEGLFLKTSYPWEKSLEKALTVANASVDSAAVEPVVDKLTEILSLSQLRILDLLMTGNGASDIEDVFNWDWKLEEKEEKKNGEELLAIAYENLTTMIESETPEWDFLRYGLYMALAIRNLKQDQARRTVLGIWDDYATNQILFDVDWGEDEDEDEDITAMPGVKAGADAPAGGGDDSDDWERGYERYHGLGGAPSDDDGDEDYIPYGGPE